MLRFYLNRRLCFSIVLRRNITGPSPFCYSQQKILMDLDYIQALSAMIVFFFKRNAIHCEQARGNNVAI